MQYFQNISNIYIRDGATESAFGFQTGVLGQDNQQPLGELSISGIARVGQNISVVTSEIFDPDGFGSFVGYMWYRDGIYFGGGGDGTSNPTATGYTLGTEHCGEYISVSYTYIDGAGNQETVLSEEVLVGPSENSAATGATTITGTARQGQILSAEISSISDADGIIGSTITYQWLRDGNGIANAASASYGLTQADVGRNISVRYSYTDSYGTAESITSAATEAVQNVNDRPQGKVLLTVMTQGGGGSSASASGGEGGQSSSAGGGGASAAAGSSSVGSASAGHSLAILQTFKTTSRLSVTEGQTVQADTSGVTDLDGINVSSITYQWLRNGSVINEATGSTYSLTQADVGARISVRYSYTDNYGTRESVVSAATAAVQNVNDLPTGAVTVSGVARQGQTLAANTSGVTDADGINMATIAYQWLRDGIAISGAAGSSYSLAQDDVGRTISVRYTYTDTYGATEELSSAGTVAVQNINDLPLGLVGIGGQVKVGSTLSAKSANLSDADGLGELSYQWLRDGVAIADATSSAYRLAIDDHGHRISVRLTYTDGFGQQESVTSTKTLAVAPSHSGTKGSNVLTGTAQDDLITGLAGNDWIFGTAGNDALYGGGGNDTIDDGTGDDTIDGGAGIDTLKRNYAFATDYSLTLEINLETGTTSSPDFPEENPDILISIENLVVTGRCSFVLTGNAVANMLHSSTGNDFLRGNGGNDTLNGGGGSDTMIGGIGDDYFITNGGDTILESPGQGRDTVESWANYSLGDNIEDLILAGSRALTGTGNALANKITGNGAANALQGMAGNDLIIGLSGSDTLEGGSGGDTLTGGKGNDRLIGGSGADVFVFNRGDGTDVVTDFVNGLDVLQIGTGAESFADVTVHDSGQNVVIMFANVQVTLLNMDHLLIDVSDFAFV